MVNRTKKSKKENKILLVNYDPIKPSNDFKCGNSMFSDNIWDFNGLGENEHLSGARLMIKFVNWVHKPVMLNTVKNYIVTELLTGSFNTTKRMHDAIKRFIKFLNENAPEIDSFNQVSESTMTSYFTHLLESKNESTGESLGGQGIKKSAQAIRDLLIRGNVKGWQVPNDLRYLQRLYDQMIINNKKVREDTNKRKDANNIPDEKSIDRIIKLAEKDLESEDLTTVLTAASILITTQTSRRVNEFITIKTGCLEQFSGTAVLNYMNRKLTKEDIGVVTPANELVVKAISYLEKRTLTLREESGKPYLFLTRNRRVKGAPVVICSHANWNKNYLKPWIKRHGITDKNGDPVDFTSHTFRHTFATYAIKGGASISFVAEMMGHDNIRGTTFYTHTNQEDIDKSFAAIYNENAILSGKQALTIKDKLKTNNPFKGKTTDQVTLLRKAMKIQILSHGFCTHHPMTSGKPCEGDGVCLGCNNFLTSPEFLKVHEGRLAKVRKQLSETAEDGPYEHKLKGIEAYLEDIINDLKQQVKERDKSV